jgi:3-dehydroquinate dehydratase-2
MRLDVLNGPNLDLLGTREPGMYGTNTLAELDALCMESGGQLGCEVMCFQTNDEARLLARMREAHAAGSLGFVINAAAWTHTSVAVRDSLLALGLPFIEVHLSNVFARESFRHTSLLSDRALGVITGLGPDGYRYAIDALYRAVR